MQRTKVNRNFFDTCDSDLAFFLPIDFGDPEAERCEPHAGLATNYCCGDGVGKERV
jgi:hypothetical protein